MSDEFDQAIARLETLKRSGDLIALAHSHCGDHRSEIDNDHRSEIDNSAKVGCFYFCDIYEPALIEDWIDEGNTALCPKSAIDSVIGDASGFPVTDPAFLKSMNKVWF